MRVSHHISCATGNTQGAVSPELAPWLAPGLWRSDIVEGGELPGRLCFRFGRERNQQGKSGHHGLRVFDHLHSSLDESFLGPGGRQTMTRKGAMFLNSSWLTVALTIKQLPVFFTAAGLQSKPGIHDMTYHECTFQF